MFLLSLAGVPGTAGFAGKFFIFRAAVESRLVWLAIIGVVTTVVSFYYYLYILVQMYMRDPTDDFADVRVPGSLKLALAVALSRSALPGSIAYEDSGLDDSGCVEIRYDIKFALTRAHRATSPVREVAIFRPFLLAIG